MIHHRLVITIATCSGFVVVVPYRPSGPRRATAAETFSETVSAEAEATKRDLAAVRSAFSEFLVRSHDERLSHAKQTAASMASLEAKNKAIAQDLKATQDAFGAYLREAHEEKLRVRRRADEELAATRAELKLVREAYADYMVRAHERTINATVSLQSELAATTKELEAMKLEFDELEATFNQHVEDTDTLIERQSTDLSNARKALAGVAAAVAAMPEAAT